MSETKTVWHPYPKQKPFSTDKQEFISKEMSYICTIKMHKKTFVAELSWLPFFKKFERLYWNDTDKYVIAWAELPEPYNPKENNNESR